MPASPSAAAASDIVCYVNPVLGVVTNVRQADTAACTVGGVEVTIPTAGKYLTKVEMAVDKELPFIGRLAFHVRDTLDGKPSVHTCGWAGGDAVSLFPAGYIAASIDGASMMVLGGGQRPSLDTHGAVRWCRPTAC